MTDGEIINFDDMNYAIYRFGSWKNSYEINQIGLSREIPVTEWTLKHVKLTMEEIRKSQFNISDKDVRFCCHCFTNQFQTPGYGFGGSY